MRKLFSVVGARPQFIKASALEKEVRRRKEPFHYSLIHTGQHYDEKMSSSFFKELSMPPPDYNLDIQGEKQGEATAKMLASLEELFLSEKPDWVIVFGDTNSTLAASLAATKLSIPLAHIEAGLRSFNPNMSEEINRKVCDHLSTLLFTPSEKASDQLKKEGIEQEKIIFSGDIMLDVCLHYKEIACEKSALFQSIAQKKRPYALATVHRAENSDNKERLRGIFSALDELSQTIDVVLPLHPRTKKNLKLHQIEPGKNITLLEPIGYLDTLALLQGASLVLTDSGGLQKEAIYMGAPCVLMRDETEWTELLDGKSCILSGTEKESIVSSAYELLGSKRSHRLLPYGDGSCSKIVLDTLLGAS